MNWLKEKLTELAAFRQLLEKVEKNRIVQLIGLSGSLRAFIAQGLSETLDRPLLYIANDLDSAEKLRDDLELLGLKLPFAFMPPLKFDPYDTVEASPSLLRLRIETTQTLIEHDTWLAVTTPQALLESLPLPEEFVDLQLYLKRGMEISFDKLLPHLTEIGLERVEIVENVGQFSVRGGIVDVYVWNYDDPLRIEFFGNQIDSMRFFDVISQRSIKPAQEATLLPNLENRKNRAFIDQLLPENAILFFEDWALTRTKAEQFLNKASRAYQDQQELGIENPPPQSTFLTLERLDKMARRLTVCKSDLIRDPQAPVVDFNARPHPDFNGSLKLFVKFLQKQSAERMQRLVIIQTANQEQKERLEEIIEEEDLPFRGKIEIGTLHNGFSLDALQVDILTDHEIFKRYKRKKAYRRFKSGEYLRQLSGLNLYDYVVHVDYGIGQYLGMETISYGSVKKECIKIGYQDGDYLYVTVDRLNRVQKYSSEGGGAPKLTKLGTSEWERAKQKTKESIQKIAAELIQIYAARKAHGGHRFSSDNYLVKELEATFPYEETPDQLRAIEEVKADMERPEPMDRLLCGDVGFGKTEVALRAAFKAILDGKQVALLAPTTILAFQHYKTFTDRFREFPVNVEMLNRFRTPARQKKIIQALADGSIDLVIGTHRLLSEDVKFKDLGLLIIDEEQRFGVRQKEKLKKLRVSVDVLSMTATPIPRTLHIALMGARDLSNIDTPPSNRLPVHTEIIHWNDRQLRHIILKELQRDGQVYFVHNRVETIEGVKEALSQIVPEARIAVGHGQLPEKQLEQVMLDFMAKKYDVLLATMIIENGLDIPNVNTIIINRADKLGLAQLYQLRGRVGRSNEQAYAYLLVPPMEKLSSLARKRLRAIMDFTELGSGYKVALRDLELRGAGNLLGKEQSGFVQSVGFEMYCRILDEAVHELRQGLEMKEEAVEKKIAPQRPTDPKLDVDFDLLIPADYIPYELERITIYHRLVNFTGHEQVQSLKEELIDRFGQFPPEVELFLMAIELKILAGKLFAERIIINDRKIKLFFSAAAEKEDLFFSEYMPRMMNQTMTSVRFLNQKNLGVEFEIKGKEKQERMQFAINLLHYIIDRH
ncbi:transcription-repair coupling factor [Caldithrix abyssi DSM 13497]|uniref:Transcription-repair-coupling factor n=1 Tax=Caldithrix abyssi DSM 13497 TaxID=880073 RepID=H1XSV5_CALAY|nr:transcription-repair coupling factor [Caldithrix abyssi]APF20282.1 mfd transcription-repair coupling factor [Caldithrix abyssi DSM 13497]EHO40332.1 transcription-repair coupling factor [Caldithrix abyssi DSM 13497]